jgi:hypothetical protein
MSSEIIERIVNQLVWSFPSHSFVIDLQEAKDIGLNVEELDSERTELCDKLLSRVKRCFGFVTPTNNITPPNNESQEA